ncbi:MAG: hypothetical protein ACK5NB_09885 [Flavobacteriaceae bacterium]
MKKYITIVLVGILALSCFKDKTEKKGFQVREITEDEQGKKIVGLPIDSLQFETRPRNVLLTYNNAHRLTPIYKVNYDKRTKKPYTGSNAFHTNWEDDNDKDGNNWNNNFMPGFEAVYGYNFVNISHFNNETKTENTFFENPVLVKTLYYPAFSKDTLNFEPVKRNFYMVSVYDEDSNNDGFINAKDLRRLYGFDINGKNKKTLVPKNYSVMSSEYDPANDFMYIFAKKDQNQNGQMELNEPTNVFWIDLKNLDNNGRQYGNE